MPARPVHDEQGDCPNADALADFSQMLVHGFDVDGGQHQAAANATGRADGTEQIRPAEAPVAPRTRTGAAPGPDAGQRALLANPCLVLKPDLDQLACMLAERLSG